MSISAVEGGSANPGSFFPGGRTPNLTKYMKKNLLTLLLSSLALGSARADLIWYESFNYADGPVTNSGVVR